MRVAKNNGGVKMLVTVNFDERQSAMLKRIMEVKALKTKSSAIALCIAEMHNFLFGQNNNQENKDGQKS